MAERKTAKPKTFEQMLARLDEIVRSLEKGDAVKKEHDHAMDDLRYFSSMRPSRPL